MSNPEKIIPLGDAEFWASVQGRGSQETFEAALLCERLDIAQKLWSKRAENNVDVNAKSIFRSSPLSAAAHVGALQSLHLLLSWGAQLDAKNPLGRTALMEAVISGHVAAVQMLLATPSGPDLARATNTREECALQVAVSFNQWACADVLAPWSEPRMVQDIFKRAGPHKMPQWAARLEREALAAELGKAAVDAPAVPTNPQELVSAVRSLGSLKRRL